MLILDTQVLKLQPKEVTEGVNIDLDRPPFLAKLIKIYLATHAIWGTKTMQRMARSDHLRAPLVQSNYQLGLSGTQPLYNLPVWHRRGTGVGWRCYKSAVKVTMLSWRLAGLAPWGKQSLQTFASAAFLVSLPSSIQDSIPVTLVGSQFPGKQVLCFRVLIQGLVKLCLRSASFV